MKRTTTVITALCGTLFLLGFHSCEKPLELFPSHEAEVTEITFAARNTPSTRVSVVSSMSSFNVLAATGPAGSQSNYWGSSATATKSGDVYYTGKYWARTNPSITAFYASNAAMTFNAAGPTVTVDSGTDVVCAYLANPTFNDRNSLAFNHILARIGTVTINTQSGYTISGISATLQGKVTSGTYNIRTGAWSGKGAGSNQALAISTSGSANDIWLVPGTYTFAVTYTLTKGDYTETFNKSCSVTLVAGCTNNITTTAVGGNAGDITISVSIAAWSGSDIDAVL